MKKVLKNCNILTATNVFIGDILLEEGIIKEVGTDISCDGCEVVNVNGKYVLPGGVDQHVHFSFEYNGSKVRGFETSNAAAIGGTTTVIEFINQIKGKGLVESIEEYIKDQVEGIAMVDYSFHSVMTDPREEVIEEIPSLADKGYPTMKLFMAYKGMFFHSDDDAILKALLKGKKSGVTIMVHAENADMIDVLQNKITKQKLVELFSTNPAKINGISHRKGDIAPGYDADLVVFDPSWEGIISNENSLQGVDYNPYEGMKQIGRVEKVFLRGNLIVDDAKYIGSQGDGELVKGKPYGMCYDEINIDVKLQNENAFA